MTYHIWTIRTWEKNQDLMRTPLKRGLRLRFDPQVHNDVRESCKRFSAFLRKKYEFPKRVTVKIKHQRRIRAMDGTLCVGTFWRPDDYSEEPYARIAAGDYDELVQKWGETNAKGAILKTIAHELTHYFQWINALELTPIGEERQATRYSKYILDEYAFDCIGINKDCSN